MWICVCIREKDIESLRAEIIRAENNIIRESGIRINATEKRLTEALKTEKERIDKHDKDHEWVNEVATVGTMVMSQHPTGGVINAIWNMAKPFLSK